MSSHFDHLQRVFGVERIPPSERRVSKTRCFDPVCSLADVCFPEVFEASMYPTVEALALLRSGRMWLPEQCCVCGAEPWRELPLPCLSLLGRFKRLLRCDLPFLIPHCFEHGAEQSARFLVFVHYLSKPYVAMTCYGLHEDFLKELYRMNTHGERYPPWKCFPNHWTDIGWNQGMEGSWWDEAWVPFWNNLTVYEQDEYLIRWDVSPDWKEALLYSDPHGNWICPGIEFRERE